MDYESSFHPASETADQRPTQALGEASRETRDTTPADALHEARAEAPPATPRMLNTEQAAAYVGLAKNTLEKARVCGDGPFFVKFSDRAVRYLVDDLDAWIAQHRAASTSELRGRPRTRLTPDP